MAKQLKLKTLVEDIFNEQPQINKYEVVEGVRSYGIVGKPLYSSSNIMEIAKQLSHIAEQAHTHILGETDDWFDKVSVNKNMQTLKRSVAEFKKAATESNQLNQRLTGLYEDIGHVLNRYYEIDEALDTAAPEKVEPEDDFEDREDKDIDNDGDTDDSDKFIHKKRQAITKAMKKETKEAPGELDNNEDEEVKLQHGSQYDEGVMGGVVGIPSLGQIARKFTVK